MKTTWGNWWWPAYLITAFLAFIVPEIYALFRDDWNTLSFYAWQDEPTIGSWEWILSIGLWLAFTVWITGHIWFKIWR
jgi:hypothetical protein